MSEAEIFTTVCQAIWFDRDDWQLCAARFFKVRASTIVDWSTGRRSFGPRIMEELAGLADQQHDSMTWAGLQCRALAVQLKEGPPA
jgi:hypothetical protein